MAQIQNYDNASAPGVARFNLYGRNSVSDEWTQLAQVTGLSYSMGAQKRTVYFMNKTPYNQFKFENLAPADSSCNWGIQSLNLFATDVLSEPSPLIYPTSTVIFKDTVISEIVPEGDGYYGFSISPALPEGLTIDPYSGWVSGTFHGTLNPTQYTVTAHKKTGGTATATFTLVCEICTGGRSLMTIRIRADGYPQENSWKLYQDRGTAGTVLRSVDTFPVKENYYYLDFCLNDGLYTFWAQDSYGDGWSSNTGYTLTVDMGEMELEIEELWGAGNSSPKMVSTTFSTFFPFQIEYTDWKVYQNGAAPEGWNGVSFDESAWETKKAADIANTNSVTTYIRKSFQLTGIDNYQVLNVRVKYTGGVVAYFNGNRVARFNIIDSFDASTESIEIHDASVFSKFHIVLVAAGVQEGTNVIAFEVHRPVGTSSSDPFVFDATGVFGVNDCSTVIDSYSSLTSTLNATSLANVMDLDPFTVATPPNTIGTYIEWTVENLEGSRWNSFNILGSKTVDNWGFNITTSMLPEFKANKVVTKFKDQSIISRTKPQLTIPVALVGFRKVRWEVTNVGSTSTDIGSVHVAYCKPADSVFPGIDNYPPVNEGYISLSTCPKGLIGYSYRECMNGQLGEVKMDMCMIEPPKSISYPYGRYYFVMGTQSQTGIPTYDKNIIRWYLDEGVVLPEGLTLNEKTGQISGIPTVTSDVTTFTVFAENESGAASTTVSISIRKGQCMAEGVFPMTEVGIVAEYDYTTQGTYTGTLKRACVLGETDGEWQEMTGSCTPLFEPTELPTLLPPTTQPTCTPSLPSCPATSQFPSSPLDTTIKCLGITKTLENSQDSTTLSQ